MKTLYFGRMPEGGKVSLKAQLRAEVASIARLRPDIRITTVADAAPDNWSFLSTLAPDAPQVIDFWHAAQHLRAAADAAFGADCGNGGKWFEKYRGILREQTRGIDKVIRALRYLCGKHPKARPLGPQTGVELLSQTSPPHALPKLGRPKPADWLGNRRGRKSHSDRSAIETLRTALGKERRAGSVEHPCPRRIQPLRCRVEGNCQYMEDAPKRQQLKKAPQIRSMNGTLPYWTRTLLSHRRLTIEYPV